MDILNLKHRVSTRSLLMLTIYCTLILVQEMPLTVAREKIVNLNLASTLLTISGMLTAPRTK